MSRQITVKPGEDLRSIAARTYGDATLWPTIARANQKRVKTTSSESVAAGSVITVPDLPAETALRTGFAAARLAGQKPDALTISIDGVDITPTSARILRTMDTGADGWSAQIAWSPGVNSGIDRVTRPYIYPPASVYIGPDLVVNGLLYSVEPRLSNEGRVKNLEGWSYTADAVDSTLKPPYERNNVGLRSLAAELVGPIGIRAVFDAGPGGPFKRVSADPSDTIFGFLAELATQRGLLVSSTPNGDLLFTRAASGAPAAVLEEGQPGVTGWGAKFNGRQRYNAYRMIGQSPGANAKAAVALDTAVPRTRFKTAAAMDTTTGDIQAAADWRRSKALADALTIPLTVDSWLAPGGDRWAENTLVTVVSPTLHLANGHNLLIRSVEYVLDGNQRTAVLSLVPPEVYTGGVLVDPWA